RRGFRCFRRSRPESNPIQQWDRVDLGKGRPLPFHPRPYVVHPRGSDSVALRALAELSRWDSVLFWLAVSIGTDQCALARGDYPDWRRLLPGRLALASP